MERVYVRHDHSVWIPARVVKRDKDGGRVCVRVDGTDDVAKDGRVPSEQITDERWLDEQDIQNNTLPMGQSVDVKGECGDLARLDEINEAAILTHLIRRYENGRTFTRCGDILLALYPFPLLAAQYDLTSKSKYFEKNHVGAIQEEKKEETTDDDIELEPHVYEVSGKAFRSMRETGKDQTIAIMGEANSGKSTTATLLVGHFVSLSKETILSRQILHASTVFEAFGNSQTRWNVNSTRNAKVMSFEFDQIDGALVGASFRHFMLESTRAISRSSLDQNFNVFYQLLAAPPDAKAKVLGQDWAGATTQDFSYLISSTSPELQSDGDWEKTSRALLLFGWEGKSLQHLMQATSIVLLLGNVTFSEHDDTASIQSRADLNMLAISLGVAIEDLEEAMTERQVSTNDGNFDASQPQAEAAKELCDSLAKAIYECLFVSICRQINILTAAPPMSSGRPKLIHLVDMFGFDCQDTNGLGQMLINFANERMHLKYVVECFREKRNILGQHKMDTPQLSDLDNSNTVALFESSEGIFKTIIENAKLNHKKNIRADSEAITAPALLFNAEGTGQFSVKHFIQTVDYQGAIFHSDRLPHKIPGRLLRLLSQSKNPILSQEFGRLLSGHHTAAKRAIKRRSVTEAFHRELRDLLIQTKSSSFHFIRCIKMKRDGSSGVDHSLITKQIRYGGLVPCASSIDDLLCKCQQSEERKRARAALVLTQWAGPKVTRLLLGRTIDRAATRISSWFRSHHRRRRYISHRASALIITRYARRILTERETKDLEARERSSPAESLSSVEPFQQTKDSETREEPPSSVELSVEIGQRVVSEPAHDFSLDEGKAEISVASEHSTVANEKEENRHLRLLVAELQQNILHTEMHNQDMEIEYEERLSEYEREVLVLRRQLSAFESEKATLKGEVEASSGNVESLKEGIRGLQESHKGYLEKVMRAVEKANVEHSKALEAMKRTSDNRISQLTAEIDSLRQRQKIFDLSPDEKHKKVGRLARKLEKLLSPISIAQQLSEASGIALDLDHIEGCISSKARNLLYRLEDISTANTSTANTTQLEHAYNEIEMLQSQLKGTKPVGPFTTRRIGKVETKGNTTYR